MDKAIITVLLLIGGVVLVAYMINGLFPVVNRGNDAVVSMSDIIDDRIKSNVSIIHAVSEYDASQPGTWRDLNSNGWFDIIAWVKNVGSSRVLGIEECDVFFGTEGNFQRYSHSTYASGTPNWVYSLEDSASDWSPGKTNKITLRYALTYVASGLSTNTTYKLKLIIPNGISDELCFSW